MSKLRIFVSYSSSDRPFLDDLLQHFPQESETAQLSIWDDSQIQVGTSWAVSIDEAMRQADAALLMLSPAFYRSSYIRNTELPVLLARYADAQAKILPLFVQPADHDDEHIDYTAPDHTTRRTTLVRFQGFKSQGNTPDRTLLALKERSKSDYQTVLVAIKTRLRGLANEMQRTPPAQVPGRPVYVTDGHRPVLDAAFVSARSGFTLTWTASRNGSSLPSRQVDPSAVLYSVRNGSSRGTAAFEAAVAAHTNPDTIQGGGDALSTLLLGTDAQTSQIIQLCKGAPGALTTGLREIAPRVRIHAELSQTITRLPWRWTGPDDNRLERDGWTFEVVSPLSPLPVELHFPFKTLVCCTSDELAEAIQKRLVALHTSAADLKFFHRVQTVSDLISQRHLTHFKPQVVVVAAAAENGANGPCFSSCHTPLSTLDDHLAAFPPLVLDVALTALEGKPLPLPRFKNARCSVVHRVTGAQLDDLAWLFALLSGGDPVQSLAQLQEPQWQNTVCTTAYTEWRVPVVPEVVGLRFDRKKQREQVAQQVRELWRPASPQVIEKVRVLCAFGASSHRVGDFAQQARTYVKERATDIPVVWVNAPVPRAYRDKRDLHDAVVRQVTPPEYPYYELQDTLKFLVERDSPGSDHCVLWLDLGACSPNGESETLLNAVVDWAASTLPDAVPPTTKVVVYMALELPEPEHHDLDTRVRNDIHRRLRRRPPAGQTGFSLLPALGNVDEQEIFDYVVHGGELQVPQQDADDVAQLVFDRSDRGLYESAWKELKEVHRLGSHAYIQKYRKT